MRCEKCNVDLAEEYTVCPLCGSPACDTEPVLKGLKTASYPEYPEELLTRSHNIKSDFPFKYVLRAVMPVCVVLWVIYFAAGKNPAVLYPVPVLTGLTGLLYFFLALKEKGRLLHYGIALLSCTGFQLVMTVVSLIAGAGNSFMLIALGVCLILLGVTFIVRPNRMVAQLKATFKV